MSYPRLFTVDEYYRMGEVGILPEDASVELIEGQIVEASPIGPRHAACVTKLTMLLHRTLSETMVSTRNPVRLSKYSELQPDITVAHARADFYASAHPTAADVLFLVEVADASLTYDRHTKLPLFARSGIAEAWLVNLINGVVEVHTSPGAADYQHVERYKDADVLPRLGVPAGEIIL